MKIVLYKTTSPNNKVDKSLTKVKEMNDGVLREESSVINPVITIQATNPSHCNYAYIEEFHRYYFIDEITAVRNKIWRLTLSVDPLYTYRKQIRETMAVIDKQQGSDFSSQYFNDGSFVTREDNFVEVYPFENGFNGSGNFILLTAGALSE